MNDLTCKVFSLGFLCLLLIPSCQKDNTNVPVISNYRLISVKTYYNDQIGYERTFEYNGNQLSRIIENEEQDMLFTYPMSNEILITYNNYGDRGTTTMTLSNSKVIEYVHNSIEGNPMSKETYSYNSDGNVLKITAYSYQNGWIIYRETFFTYSSKKVIKVENNIYYNGETYLDIREYSYNGDEISNIIYSFKAPGEDANPIDKYVYSYSNGKISKITLYFFELDWIKHSEKSYTYNSEGNLEKEIETYEDSSNELMIEYTYEYGSSNYNLFTETVFNFEFEVVIGTPNKR